jgi:hypothetical protein
MKTIFHLIIFVPFGFIISQTENSIQDHGIPIQSSNRISYKTAKAFGKNKDDLLCWTTTAESGGHFVAMNLRTKKYFVHPLNHLEAYPIVYGSNGKVYIGSTSGYVMVWNPIDDSWKEAGSQIFNVPNNYLNHVRVLCEGMDGWLYAGSCLGERARLNMENGTVEYLPKITEDGSWYISAATTLPDGKIAFGLGYKARILIYDPQKHMDVAQWMPGEYQKDGFCFNIIAGKNVVYATHFPSGHRLCFDLSTGDFLKKIPWPDHHMDNLWSKWNHSSGYGSAVDFYINTDNDAVITFDGKKIYQYHPKEKALTIQIDPTLLRIPPNLDIALQYEVTNDGNVIHYDYRNQKIKEVLTPKLPPVERNIFSITTGPDKQIYGGAYQSTLLFRYGINDTSLSVLGDHHPGWSGETYSFINRGDELICASYTNGAVVAYNPSRSWDCMPNKMNNPHLLGFFGQNVYRPTDICIDFRGDIWAVGPCGWGTAGGGVAKLSYSSKKVQSHNFHDVPHSLVPITQSMLILCSDSLIRWWDTRGDSLIAQSSIPFSATSLCMIMNKKDTLLFLSSIDSIKKIDLHIPGIVKVIDGVKTPISISRLITNHRNIYFGGNQGIGMLNPQNLKTEVLTRQPLSNRFAFTVVDSTVFFGSKGHLLSIKYGSPAK